MKFFSKIFDHQAGGVNSAAIILAVTSFGSALLGLFRDRLLAGSFGAGNELDVYYAAFRIPDFIAMTLVIGAISVAIIPVFCQYLAESQEKAFRFLSNLLNVFLFSLIFISVILIIFTPQALSIIAPGFSPEKKEAAVLLTRIMFLSPILLGIGNIISSVLQVFKRFLITSFCPVVYNLGIIFGILFFVPKFGLAGLAWGVVLGGIFYLLIQMPTLWKVGFRPAKILNFKDRGFLKVVKLTIPRSIGLATNQINLIIITAIASTLAAGSITIFNLAETLSRPLYTFAAVSFSTAAFPALAMAFSRKDNHEFNQVFSLTFNKILLFILPASLVLFIFRDFVIKIILEVGKFSTIDTKLTAACFGLFVCGIFAKGLVLLIAKSFYALGDTKTPALLSVGDAIFTLGLCILFLKTFPTFGMWLTKLLNIANYHGTEVIVLPLAISISAVCQFIVLFLLFSQKRRRLLN